MNTQEEAFLSSEGDAWHQRNQKREAESEERWFSLLSGMWERLPLREGNRILEIGCGSGRNLAFLRQKYGVECYGLDPSQKAVEEGSKELHLSVGTASRLPFEDDFFDCLFFGFCLYLCDRNILFSIAAEANRVLRSGGVLLICDFSPPFPYRNTYSHKTGLHSYKMRYSDMFTWNPAYTLIESRQFSHGGGVFHPDLDERVELAALYKSDPVSCYLTDPFSVGDKVKAP